MPEEKRWRAIVILAKRGATKNGTYPAYRSDNLANTKQPPMLSIPNFGDWLEKEFREEEKKDG